LVDTISRTRTAGYTQRNINSLCETFSMPYFGCPPAAGIIDSVSGALLDSATSIGVGNIATALTAGREYYIEITSGDHVGHRIELDETNTTATTLAVDLASPRNTLTSLPATLAGDHWSLRPHHTFKELFPPSKFSTPTNDRTTADRITFQSTNGFTYLWLYLNQGNPQWVAAADAGLGDAGINVVPPGMGVYVRPRNGSVSLTYTGFVRTNPFALPLKVGTPFVGGGWPMVQSPSQRGVTAAAGFVSNRSATMADKIILWNGDKVANAQGYTTYYHLSFSSQVRWVAAEDASISSQDNSPLFDSTRAVFIKVNQALPNYISPMPWIP
jgi:hypothetical protein